ncbi:MAG: cell division protein FtsQ/DivIB [Vulcanimicrobiaceae bacterium]
MSASARARIGRRTKPSVFRRLRVFWVFIAALLPVIAYGSYRLATWSVFEPKEIVVAGNVHVSSAEIRRRAAIPLDGNVWFVNKHAAEHRVDALPWVRTAQIHRTLPAYVRVVVVEREPAACVVSSGAAYLVDADAHVIESSCASREMLRVAFPPLGRQHPGAVLDAPFLQRLLADAETLRHAQLDAETVGRDPFGGLEAQLRSGVMVRFGDDTDLARKAALVGPILTAYGGHRGQVAAIDVRAASTPVVELRRPKK